MNIKLSKYSYLNEEVSLLLVEQHFIINFVRAVFLSGAECSVVMNGLTGSRDRLWIMFFDLLILNFLFHSSVHDISVGTKVGYFFNHILLAACFHFALISIPSLQH